MFNKTKLSIFKTKHVLSGCLGLVYINVQYFVFEIKVGKCRSYRQLCYGSLNNLIL